MILLIRQTRKGNPVVEWARNPVNIHILYPVMAPYEGVSIRCC